MRIVRPAAGVLLLALTLGASTGFAATAPAARQGAAARGDLLDQLRGFLVSLWSPEGCRIDPLGRCLPGVTTSLPGTRAAVPQPPMPDTGCRIDPLGGCISQP